MRSIHSTRGNTKASLARVAATPDIGRSVRRADRCPDRFPLSGCRWRAMQSHGQHGADALVRSKAGALRACRLPIQQRAMTGTGLQAMSRQISGEDCSAAVYNLPSVIRLFVRQPRGVRASGHDAATCCPPSDPTGIRRAISSPHPGGVSVIAQICFFWRTLALPRWSLWRGGRQAYPGDKCANVEIDLTFPVASGSVYPVPLPVNVAHPAALAQITCYAASIFCVRLRYHRDTAALHLANKHEPPLHHSLSSQATGCGTLLSEESSSDLTRTLQ